MFSRQRTTIPVSSRGFELSLVQLRKAKEARPTLRRLIICSFLLLVNGVLTKAGWTKEECNAIIVFMKILRYSCTTTQVEF